MARAACWIRRWSLCSASASSSSSSPAVWCPAKSCQDHHSRCTSRYRPAQRPGCRARCHRMRCSPATSCQTPNTNGETENQRSGRRSPGTAACRYTLDTSPSPRIADTPGFHLQKVGAALLVLAGLALGLPLDSLLLHGLLHPQLLGLQDAALVDLSLDPRLAQLHLPRLPVPLLQCLSRDLRQRPVLNGLCGVKREAS